MQSQERILAIHDISCVGRCSLTVALPIVSSVGIECSVLPTAVLSTHTGGFTGYTYRDLTEDIAPVKEHWKSLGLKFGAIYSGFLGSKEQIDLVADVFDEVSDEKTTIYVDPVMGDAGKLYTVFDMDFAKQMRKLCEKADVIMPNLTELCFMLGLEYREGPYTKEYISDILDKAEVFGAKKIVITGVSYSFNSVGAVYKDYETGETGDVMRRIISGYYHGTGDVFGSALVAALEKDVPLDRAVRIAVDFTVGSIIRTYNADTDVRYGVNFEDGIKDFIIDVEGGITGVQLIPASSEADLHVLEQVGTEIWSQLHGSKAGSMDTVESLTRHIEEGYTYMMVPKGDDIIGYVGYKPENGRMRMTSMRLLESERGAGFEEIIMDYIRSAALHSGLSTIEIVVNVHSKSAMALYRDLGFMAMDEERHTLPDGREIRSNVMELNI